MKHWAFDLIGQEWPDHSCWSFVQHVCRMRCALDMPDLESMQDVTRGWRPRGVLAQVDDIVVMSGPRGRHAGWMTQANGRLGVLHAHGTVLFETMHDLRQAGYGDFKFWGRKT